MSLLPKNIRDAIFEKEEDDETPVAPQAESVPIPIPTATPVSPQSFEQKLGSDATYRRLLLSTSPASEWVLSKILTLSKPLEGVIGDAKTRMKVVLAQSGATSIAVMQDVDKLISALNDQRRIFENGRKKASDDLQAGDKNRAKAIETNLQSLQTELVNCRSRIATAERDIEDRSTAFECAFEKRMEELMDLKSQFTNL